MSASEPGDRLLSIEEKLAYLEKLALDLSDVVAAQDRQLEELSVRLKRVSQQVEALGLGEPDNSPPPHY